MKNKLTPYNPKLKEYARELRKNSTLPEVILWKKLQKRSFGVQFHRQVPLLDYIVDFYCHEIQLAIEVDGNIHEFKYFEDSKRQNKLESYDITFIRFNNNEILKDMFSVEMAIREKVEELITLNQ